VKVYTPAQLRQGEYETVKRLWVETWRTPFWCLAILRVKMASPQCGTRRGAGRERIDHVDCYGDKGFFSFGSESFVCYGKRSRFLEPLFSARR